MTRRLVRPIVIAGNPILVAVEAAEAWVVAQRLLHELELAADARVDEKK